MKSLKQDFQKIFKEYGWIDSFFAPGRVNLIGEHTDYNGGCVFPCALSVGTYMLIGKRKDRNIRLYSKNFSDRGIIQFSLDQLDYTEEDDWANYPKGIFKKVKEYGKVIDHGLDIYYYGDIPNGAGLSSSASIEMVTLTALNEIFHLDLDPITMIKLGQKVENEFIGVNCGIMDQFAVGMGKKDHAILLNCKNLNYEYVPMNLEGISIVIGNTNKRRGLSDSKYNQRREECNEALKDLKTKLSMDTLGDLSEEDFMNNQSLIKDPICRKRAKHVVYENLRTKKAVKLLRNKNLEGFGELMKASHMSLKEDYEVTGKELDTIVSLAWEHEGIIGARMTGAGFGGCSVNLVKDHQVEDFIQKVGQKYQEKIGYKATFYVVHMGDGPKKIRE